MGKVYLLIVRWLDCYCEDHKDAVVLDGCSASFVNTVIQHYREREDFNHFLAVPQFLALDSLRG